MGICSSNNNVAEVKQIKCAKSKSKKLDRFLVNGKCVDDQISKILLLGAGSSGKSTLFKQSIIVFGEGFDAEHRCSVMPIVCNNVVIAMKTLCGQIKHFGYVVNPKNKIAMSLINKTSSNDENLNDTREGYGNLTIGNAIAQLWEDDGIKATYMKRSRFFLDDSAKYYFDKLSQIMSPEYIPSEEDIVRVRIPTTGIIETSIIVDHHLIKMYDVGGQRSERRKWIHCFENVTAILFLASLSGYDEILFEDKHSNRMVEAMNLFDEVVNSVWFANSSIILFLNKRDLFREKIKRVPLTDWFPEFPGPNTYEVASKFLLGYFLRLNNQAQKVIYTHLTCATDTHNVHLIVKSAKGIVFNRTMVAAGLT